MKNMSAAVATFDDAFLFADTYIKSYQIKSEIKSLVELLQKHKPEKYIEIGTADGGTHFLIRKLCKSIEFSVAVDTDIRNKMLLDMITETKESRYVRGFSNHKGTVAVVESLFSNKAEVDVLFIDGDHSYDGVKSDFDCYSHLVCTGGLIIFHDVVEDWGQRYGQKTNKYTGGVPKFFAEIKGDYDHYVFIEDQKQDGFGIGVIVKK